MAKKKVGHRLDEAWAPAPETIAEVPPDPEYRPEPPKEKVAHSINEEPTPDSAEACQRAMDNQHAKIVLLKEKLDQEYEALNKLISMSRRFR